MVWTISHTESHQGWAAYFLPHKPMDSRHSTPYSHHQLGIDILSKGGAIISEYVPGLPPAKYRFLERNRLTSGLSDAVLINEAAARSGTLSTAAWALDQGKEVFVVSGNITSPLSEGRTQLIHHKVPRR